LFATALVHKSSFSQILFTKELDKNNCSFLTFTINSFDFIETISLSSQLVLPLAKSIVSTSGISTFESQTLRVVVLYAEFIVLDFISLKDKLDSK